MKNFFLGCLLGMFLLGGTASAGQAEDIAAAEKASGDWLALMDEGKYPATWDTAASSFKSNISRELWKETAKAARGPIGAEQSRNLTSASFSRTVPGAPDGFYVMVEYKTQFGKKTDAVEIVTLTLDTDNAWRVYSYNLE